MPTPRKIQPIPDRLASDPVVRHVIAESASFASVKSIRIFGSRARGNHGPKSDYDLAVWWNDCAGESWGDFAGAVREKSPTLHQLDIVRMDSASGELAQKIDAEGITIYEQIGAKL